MSRWDSYDKWKLDYPAHWDAEEATVDETDSEEQLKMAHKILSIISDIAQSQDYKDVAAQIKYYQNWSNNALDGVES